MKHITVCLIVLAATPAAAREWTTASGFRFQADLIGTEDDGVQLRLSDGPMTVPWSLLCPADRLYIRGVVVSGGGKPTDAPRTHRAPEPPAVNPPPSRPAARPRSTYRSPAEITQDRLQAWREDERRRQETIRRRAATPPTFVERTGNGPYIWWTPAPPLSSKWRPE